MQRKYKKIQVIRQSKLPVTLENLQLFQQDWKNKYDILFEKHATDMKKLEVVLDELEKELQVKYPCIEEWDWITSQRKWKLMTESYGPISIVKSEAGPLVYLIMDRM